MERITITMPGKLLAAIDALGDSRSGFLAKAAARELRRRERRAFLKALDASTPEPGLADMGLSGWPVVSQDDDVNAIVDPEGGTEIRWIPGKGWVTP